MNFQQLTGRSEEHLVMFQNNLQVHRDCAKDLIEVSCLAKAQGFDFKIASAFRSYEHQLKIWNEKVQGKRTIYSRSEEPIDHTQLNDEDLMWAILNWSAIPGTSRHHWGTDFDIYDHSQYKSGKKLNLLRSEYEEGGENFQLVTFLSKKQILLFRPYGQNGTGHGFEPWHFSHQQTSKSAQSSFSFEKFKKNIEESPSLLLQKQILENLEAIYSNYLSI